MEEYTQSSQLDTYGTSPMHLEMYRWLLGGDCHSDKKLTCLFMASTAKKDPPLSLSSYDWEKRHRFSSGLGYLRIQP